MTIICFDISTYPDSQYDVDRACVSEQRRKKADRFYFKEDAVRCICGELLLQYCLKQQGKQWNLDMLSYHSHGKPYIKDMPDFQFNLSNSGNWVVIAYGDEMVGVDVERVKLERTLILDCFSKEEQEYIIKQDVFQKQRFTEVWTCKESYLKYLGIGLSRGMNFFSVKMQQKKIIDFQGRTTNNLYLSTYHLDEEYYLSVCSKDKDITIKKINNNTLRKDRA